jgi:hypothetical protein
MVSEYIIWKEIPENMRQENRYKDFSHRGFIKGEPGEFRLGYDPNQGNLKLIYSCFRHPSNKWKIEEVEMNNKEITLLEVRGYNGSSVLKVRYPGHTFERVRDNIEVLEERIDEIIETFPNMDGENLLRTLKTNLM